MKTITLFRVYLTALILTVFFTPSGIQAQTCPTTVNTFPYAEDFETGIGQWVQPTTDNFNWSRNTLLGGPNGATPSVNTGPSGASSGLYFMFTEASSNYSNTAFFESPCLDLTTSGSGQFSFDYHMYGGAMGTLSLQLSTDDGATWPTTLWTQSGQVQASYGAAWNTINADLTPYVGQIVKIRLNGLTGPNYTSDMAIDNVIVTAAAVSGPEMAVSGLAMNITDGDTTPSTLDDTDFGFTTIGAPVSKTFTIDNSGITNLTIGAITFTGAGAGDFAVTTPPASPVVPGSSTTFTVDFNPATTGLKTAVLSIANNDSNENPYNFTIQGNVLACSSTINTFPYTEGFEGGATGAWIQDTGDMGDWTNDAAGTPSNTTGPSAATEGTQYLYTEASTSGMGSNATAFLNSPCFDLTSLSNPDFNFSYHMYGSNMGALKVQVSTNNGATFSDIGWAVSGQQNSPDTSPWLTATINLLPYVGQTIVLRFHGTTGGGWASDMAIDGISLVDSVPLPEMDVIGNATSIIDGDLTPSVLDDTEFGNADIAGGTVLHTFTIANTGPAALTLTDASTYVVIGGAHATDFGVSIIPANSIASGGNTTFEITFDPSVVGLRTATLSIANDDSDEDPYNFNIQGTGTTIIPEINITGNGVSITDGDNTPAVADDTDFGDNVISFGTTTHIFTIENIGGGDLDLTGPAPYVVISGVNAAEFTLTTNPVTPITGPGSTSFSITFAPTALGLRTATLTIANSDSDEDPYNFDIIGNGTGSAAEIEIDGNGFEIIDGDTTPDNGDNTEFGNVVVAGGTLENVFRISNLGSLDLNLTGALGLGLPPYVTITGLNAADFTVTAVPANTILTSSNTNFNITFNPLALGLRTATVTINNNDSDEGSYSFTIQGTGVIAVTIAPGGISNELQLWLKANEGAGTIDGQALSIWSDQAFSNDATVNTVGQEPTWRDNINDNVNFNPVVDFDNDYTTGNNDGTNYSIAGQEFLEGSGGFYTDDIFFVVIPDAQVDNPFENSGNFMDSFCGDSDNTTGTTQDITGIGMGAYSARFSDEIISYAQNTNGSYGIAETATASTYNNIGIINARNNTAINGMELYYNANRIDNTEVSAGSFSNFNNTRYWIGRSQVWRGTMDARVVELMTYSGRKNNVSERNRIESYLALKYGITLGINGTSQNYVEASGNIIWNATANAGYNYDIAGVVRDDVSELVQKQSKSVNPTAVVNIGLGDIALTNNANTNSFNANRDYLIWGHDGNSMATAPASSDIVILLGPTTTTTITQRTQRTWKIVESGGDVPTVKVSVLQSDLGGLPVLVGNDAYVMVVADDDNFTTNVETVFLNSGTFNGSATQEITYDFDNTKFFTLGVAHETVEPRHSSFDGINDFTLIGNSIDLTGDFSASAWVRSGGSNSFSTNKTIIAKKGLTGGYQFLLRNNNQLEFNVGVGAANRVRSSTSITDNIWHHVAVTYDGINASLYIDGVLDTTSPMLSPIASSQSFTLGAVYNSKNIIFDYFNGDIDEVRIWDNTLSVTEIRYIMNQEIEKSGTGFTEGVIVPSTITKNDINSRTWSDLLAYYNMNSYLGTHLNDVSDNNNRGSLIVPNNFNIEQQTAPLPYISLANGDWDTAGTWANGFLYYMPGSASLVDNTITIDWNIVQTQNDITMSNGTLPIGNLENRTVLGLIVDSNELTVNGDSGLTVSHYLNLDGSIDLEGESQLIQTDDSELDVTSSGSLERDQQGTSDTYTYNYWSSPVGTVNTVANNQSFTVPSMLRDGTTPATPGPLNFLTGGYNGNAAPIGVADYWIWKFANQNGNDATDYAFWQHMRSTGTILVGEGYTMKGPGTGGIAAPQNYVYTGKPNNEDINLNINAGNDYLIGNPYPSALDSHEFLSDNPLTGGTLYFWEHWGGGSHLLREYQGGYAQYNYSGGTGAASYGTNDPDVGTGGTPVKLPGQYIPVAQGFFVAGASTGTINFENDQRAFVKEGGTSVFVRSAGNQRAPIEEVDTRMKLRIGFNSVNEIHRQLLLTVDDNATSAVDWGYDGIRKEEQIDDMYWMIDNDKYVIQGTNQVEVSTVVPLGIHTRDDGINEITIDKLENISGDVEIFVHDNVLDVFHDLRQSNYQVYLVAGEYTDRFNIVFNNEVDPTLDIEDNVLADAFEVHYSNEEESIVVVNPTSINVEYLEIFNILGQSIQTFKEVPNDTITQIKVKNLSTGTYIIKLSTESGIISKKVLVK